MDFLSGRIQARYGTYYIFSEGINKSRGKARHNITKRPFGEENDAFLLS